MVKIKEPFRKSSREEVVLGKDEKPIPIFSASRFSTCNWNHYCDITPDLKKPITDDLSEVFDKGNEVHRENEYLTLGARNILEHEEYLRIVHESELWGMSGLLDYDKFGFSSGQYLEDLKSTKFGGFYFFLREGVKKEDKMQMSIYAYMKYVITGTKRNRGVITKIDKEEPLNRISLVTDLFTVDEVREFIVNHPVVKVILGVMTLDNLAKLTANQIRPQMNKKNQEYWKCLNCGYATGDCPVRQQL